MASALLIRKYLPIQIKTRKRTISITKMTTKRKKKGEEEEEEDRQIIGF